MTSRPGTSLPGPPRRSLRNPLRRTPRGPAETAELSRRRFARRQWARRWLDWKYVVAVVLLVGLVAGSVWAAYFSSLLTVTGVDIEGSDQVGVGEIRRAAEIPMGDPLARVDLARIRSRVEAIAGIKSADVTRRWPHDLMITVEERQAVAVVEIGGRIRGMDDTGVVFRDFAAAPTELPRVQTSTGTRSEALAEAARVIGALPGDLVARVDHVEVETVDQIRLVLRDGRVVVWGSADDSDQKAQVLAVLLERPAQTYDVSVPGQPTTAN